MDELLTKLTMCEIEELERARKSHGEEFTSAHEAYGVIAEEVWEADEEYKHLKMHFELLIKTLHENDNYEINRRLQMIEQFATSSAAELIQVAAMCQKAIQSKCMEEENNE